MTTSNNEPSLTNAGAELTGSLSLTGNLSVNGKVGIGTAPQKTQAELFVKTDRYGIAHYSMDGSVALSTFVDKSGGWFGTASNHDLLFYTHNSPSRMTVTTDGNVGIGTTSPEAKLDVQGIIRTYNKNNTKATWDNIQIWSDDHTGYIESNGDENGLKIKSNTGGKIILESDVEVLKTLKLNSDVAVNEFSNDENLGNSDSAVPTQKAVKTYVDNKITELKINDLESKINDLESKINELKSKINKSVQIVRSDIQHCQADSFKDSKVTVSGGTILSIGFQNMHEVRHCYASQMFVLSPTEAYIQVNNTNSTDISYVVVLVVQTLIEDTDVKIEILPS